MRTPFLVPLCWWTTKSSVGRHVWRGRLWATSAPRIRVTRRSLIQLECTCVFFKTHHFDPFCPYTFSLLCCCRKPKKSYDVITFVFPAICLKEDGGCSTGLLWDHMAMAAAATTTTKWWSIAVGSELQGISKTAPMNLTGKNLATLKVEMVVIHSNSYSMICIDLYHYMMLHLLLGVIGNCIYSD